MPPTKGCYSSYYIAKPRKVNTYLIRRENMSQQFRFVYISQWASLFTFFVYIHVYLSVYIFCRSLQSDIDEEIREIKSEQKEIENKKAKLEKKRAEIIEQIKNFQNNFGSYNQKVTEKMALKDKVKAANRTIEEYDRMQDEIQAEIEKNKEEKDQKLQEIHERKQKLDKNQKLHEKMDSEVTKIKSQMQKISEEFFEHEKHVGHMETTINGHKKEIREKEKTRENFLKVFHEKKQIFLDQEKEALRLSNGLRLTENEISLTPREFKEMEIQKQKDDEEIRKKYGSNG